MANFIIHVVYSMPSLLIAFFAYRACEDKVDIEKDKAITFIVVGIASFTLCFITCSRDIAFLSSGAEFYKEYLNSSLMLFRKGFLSFSVEDLFSVLFLNISIILGRLRYNKSFKTIIIEFDISVILSIIGVNVLYIMLFMFVKFNLTFANNSRKLDMFMEMFFFILSVFIIPNSVIFSLVVTTVLFKNIKKRHFEKIFIYNRDKWIKTEEDMKKITDVRYLFIYFEHNLNTEECKEFLMFLDNISDNNNVIRIHNDMYAIAFTKIDTSFGFTDEVVEKTINSEINNAREMINRRLYFPICEEFNNVYKYIIFEGDNFLKYKEYRSHNEEANRKHFVEKNSRVIRRIK